MPQPQSREGGKEWEFMSNPWAFRACIVQHRGGTCRESGGRVGRAIDRQPWSYITDGACSAAADHLRVLPRRSLIRRRLNLPLLLMKNKLERRVAGRGGGGRGVSDRRVVEAC